MERRAFEALSRPSDGRINCASGTATAPRREPVNTQVGGWQRQMENLGAVFEQSLSECSTHLVVTSLGVQV